MSLGFHSNRAHGDADHHISDVWAWSFKTPWDGPDYSGYHGGSQESETPFDILRNAMPKEKSVRRISSRFKKTFEDSN
jgi:hypothetical protein